MKQKNKEEELDLEAQLFNDVVKELHVHNKEEKKIDNNKSFEKNDNNTNDKHEADEGKRFAKYKYTF